MSNQKGLSAGILLLIVALLIGVSGVTYLQFISSKGTSLQQPSPTAIPNNSGVSKEPTANSTITQDDSIKKSLVNSTIASIKQYYAQKGTYPKKLVDLRVISKTYDSDTTLKLLTNPPFYFTSDGMTYEFYTKLNNGEVFKGDAEEINKILDRTIKFQIDQAEKAVIFYEAEAKRPPKNLQEISTLPNYPFDYLNNPITDKPYTYILKSDGSSFIVSGTLSNGSEYKKEWSFTKGEL